MRFKYKLLTWDHKVARRPILKEQIQSGFPFKCSSVRPEPVLANDRFFSVFSFETGETCTAKRPGFIFFLFLSHLCLLQLPGVLLQVAPDGRARFVKLVRERGERGCVCARVV
jgi:hypothetical protein